MYRLDREEFLKAPLISLWSMLGFQAGFINAFGFLACGRFVSHVTGFGSQLGVSLAEKNLYQALEFLGFPLSFMLGAFCSSIITSVRLERGLRPRYDVMTLILPIIIITVCIAGANEMFGQFGEGLIFDRDFMLLFSLSFVCGAQNGCFATMTKGQIRTTHLTGISTDIGTDLARMFFGNLPAEEYRLVKKANITRFATFAAFSIGSVTSVYASVRFEYMALMIPALVSIIAYFSVGKISRYLDRVHRISLAAEQRKLNKLKVQLTSTVES
jgi:uncharacterized membrane protein YoaK (UPF0700 family)